MEIESVDPPIRQIMEQRAAGSFPKSARFAVNYEWSIKQVYNQDQALLRSEIYFSSRLRAVAWGDEAYSFYMSQIVNI